MGGTFFVVRISRLILKTDKLKLLFCMHLFLFYLVESPVQRTF